MRAGRIASLVAKDFTLYFRNRFFALITVLGLVAYVAIYYLMPSAVDESLHLGMVAPDVPPALAELFADEAVDLIAFDSQEAMTAAMLEGDFDAGIVFPPGWTSTLARGETGEVKIIFSSDFPEDLKESYIILVQELTYVALGKRLNIEGEAEVLGVDRAGAQIPPREKMLPLLAVFVLIMEVMGLGSLISSEVIGGTLRALLVTPLRVGGLFLAKGVTGVLLTFVQVGLLLAVTGGLEQHAGIVLATVLLGSLMVTGLGFLIGSVAKDMMGVIGWGIPVVVTLAIPAIGVLIAGATTSWAKAIPSYYLVDTVYQAANFDIGWADIGGNLLLLAAFSALFLGLGVVALQRKLR